MYVQDMNIDIYKLTKLKLITILAKGKLLQKTLAVFYCVKHNQNITS